MFWTMNPGLFTYIKASFILNLCIPGPWAIAENPWSQSRQKKWILELRAGGQSRQKATKYKVAQSPESRQD